MCSEAFVSETLGVSTGRSNPFFKRPSRQMTSTRFQEELQAKIAAHVKVRLLEKAVATSISVSQLACMLIAPCKSPFPSASWSGALHPYRRIPEVISSVTVDAVPIRTPATAKVTGRTFQFVSGSPCRAFDRCFQFYFLWSPPLLEQQLNSRCVRSDSLATPSDP